MDEEAPHRITGTASKKSGGATGYVLAVLGAVAGALVWAPRAAFSIDGGFEGHARDLSVLFVDLPLIVSGGALIPLLSWTLATRRVHRPWIAVLAAVATLALGVWGLSHWWTPGRQPDPGYGPGL